MTDQPEPDRRPHLHIQPPPHVLDMPETPAGRVIVVTGALSEADRYYVVTDRSDGEHWTLDLGLIAWWRVKRLIRARRPATIWGRIAGYRIIDVDVVQEASPR